MSSKSSKNGYFLCKERLSTASSFPLSHKMFFDQHCSYWDLIKMRSEMRYCWSSPLSFTKLFWERKNPDVSKFHIFKMIIKVYIFLLQNGYTAEKIQEPRLHMWCGCTLTVLGFHWPKGRRPCESEGSLKKEVTILHRGLQTKRTSSRDVI